MGTEKEKQSNPNKGNQTSAQVDALVRREDLPLLVDVTCSVCKRKRALSYCTTTNGIIICQSCAGY